MDGKEKGEGKYIPLPVTDSPPTTRFSRFKILSLSIVLVNLLALHYFVAKPTTLWLRETGTKPPPHHRKHLWGKTAEKLFLSIPNEENAIATSRLFATKPHLAGSEGDFQTAKDFLTVLQTELGIQPPDSDPVFAAGSPESRDATLSIPKTRKAKAWIDVYYPVMNTPLDRALQVINANGEVVWDAELEEVADDTDPEAGKYYTAVPTFHGLSAAGDVQGKLVYANYGRKEDYDALVEKGVDLTGSIVIVRYGAIFRGLKIKGAQELGAAGVIIYSDLRDDGAVTEKNGYLPYPHGPARNINSVQRGSVQFLSKYPGDPTTPGYPAYENSTRTDGENIPNIPSIPISAANAAKLLELAAEEGSQVHLVNYVDTKATPIWNTMGVIPGYITDEVVFIGNHRDAWVLLKFLNSGTASIVETIRGLGALLKQGWKPLRTIVIASWDAEEYGLIGSTEWVEDFPDFVDKHVVTYLNLDSSVSGSRFQAGASPSLSHFLRQAALDIPHPTKPGLSLWDARGDHGPFSGAADTESLAFSQLTTSNSFQDSLGVAPLGSGSDFTPFLQWIGVASAEGGFGGSSGDAVYHYHSVFDSQRWQEEYADPGFYRHVAVAKYLGLKILRLSTAVVLPLNTTNYAYELGNYLDGVEAIALTTDIGVDLAPLRKSITALQAASHSLDFEKAAAEKELKKIIHKWLKHRRSIRKKVRKAICKVKKALGRPCNKHEEREADREVTHHFHGGHKCNLVHKHENHDLNKDHPLRNVRIGRLPAWAKEQHEHQNHGVDPEILAMFALEGDDEDFSHPQLPKFPLAKLRKVVKRIRAVNQKLVSFERGFISTDGIPEREWYKHLAIAPGKWLGYGATPLPALAEAIEFEKNKTLAEYEVGRLVDLIDKLADNIRVHA
ncbi:Zn-dependent exopeptidase [Mycena indigotica]|uniref:Zn-dependent exopeptidase n=1 Tax=Mycena indigotica TaxID=2126181 RepID=A0A8H6SLD6_9AGAR|nr:Zn-dependent exopeptidase [Mycena indigotica]KAF7301895.1 Zn-dependent exopeptidase [Mycena indigotica]